MSRFTPRPLDPSNNVTPRHPLKEVLWLLGGVVVFILCVYLILGAILEIAIMRIPVEKEAWLRSYVALEVTGSSDSLVLKRTKKLQAILDGLDEDDRPQGYDFSIQVIDSEELNAFAYPGGTIALTSGLIKNAPSENVLVFVIGHEMGHYARRDHLRGLGRGLAAIIASGFLMGQDSGLANMVAGFVQLTDLSYSRQMEERADIWGVQTLMAHYGHAAGADDFFDLLEGHEGFLEKHVPSILSTHPSSEERIQTLRSYVADQKFPLKAPKSF